MNLNQPQLRSYLALLGAVLFGLLSIMSFYFWKERIFTFDNAYQLFLLFCDERVEVMVHRWPNASIRLLPLLAITLGASLTAVAKIFSFSYVLIQALYFGLLVFVLKQYRLALLLIAVMLFATSEGFYWCNSEQIHGLSASILFFGFVRYRVGFNLVQIIGILASLALVIFYHPLLIFPTFFLLFFDSFYNNNWSKLQISSMLALVVCWFLKRKFLVNWYDTDKSEVFNRNLDEWGFKVWQSPALSLFCKELVDKYHFIAFALVAVLVLYVLKKKYLSLAVILGACFVYLTVLFIGNPTPQNSFYVEINYYTLVIFLGFPLLLLADNTFLERPLFKWGFLGLCIFSLIRIAVFSNAFTNRHEWVDQSLPAQECNKIMMKEDQFPEGIKMLSWSLPYESLLVSSFHEKSRSIHVINQGYLEEGKYTEDRFVTSFNILIRDYVESKYLKWSRGTYCDFKN